MADIEKSLQHDPEYAATRPTGYWEKLKENK